MASSRASIRAIAAPRTRSMSAISTAWARSIRFIDTYTQVACAKLYDRKTPITAADLLDDRVIHRMIENPIYGGAYAYGKTAVAAGSRINRVISSVSAACMRPLCPQPGIHVELGRK